MGYINYLINGKNVHISEDTINKYMNKLDLTKEDAIQLYLEDEGYLVNEEQNALDKKARDSRITATIHGARSEKPRTQRKVERKTDETKETIIARLAEVLNEVAEDVKIENIGKLITFTLKEDKFKLDLIRQRPPKEKKTK